MITSGLGKEFVIGHTLTEVRPLGEQGIEITRNASLRHGAWHGIS
jgi:hypothetical protein